MKSMARQVLFRLSANKGTDNRELNCAGVYRIVTVELRRIGFHNHSAGPPLHGSDTGQRRLRYIKGQGFYDGIGRENLRNGSGGQAELVKSRRLFLEVDGS